MFSNQVQPGSSKPITSIVDHLFKEFLAKKSEMLQHQTSDTTETAEKEKRHHLEDKDVTGSKQLSKAATTHDISEQEQDTEDMTEHSDTRRHDGKHEKKKDKKHKKHKHKDHGKKKHKHHRHDSDIEHSTERFDSSERKIVTESPPAPYDSHSKHDSNGKHADEIGRRHEDSVPLVSDDFSTDSKNDRQHRKHKKGDRKLGVTGFGTVLEHLWQEEDNISNASSGDLTETRRGPNLQDESTTESEPAPNATGVSWMTLPKELERNPEVNCDTWMKLPDNLTDMEKDRASDNDQVESMGMDSDSDDPGNDKDQCAVPKLTLDLKVDITKVAKVLPPPADITKKVVSSIKKTLISDSHKLEQPPVKSVENPNEAKVDASCTKSSDNGSKSEELVAPKNSLGKMKLGIKISESSAALISSGKKADDDPYDTKIEEGEIIDQVPSGNKHGTAEKHSDKDSSSEMSVSQLSSSASASGSESDNTKSKKKEKKHKKKKKKGHKRKKRAKSPSRSRSWKKHRHSRSRSTSRSRSRSRHRSRSRSRSRSRCRSRSRRGIPAKSYDEEHGVWRSRSRSRGHKRSRSPEHHRPSRYNYSRYRSKSRDRHHDHHRVPYYHRHRSRSRSRSPVSRTTSHDDRLKIDKAELRKIAFQNAYAHLRKGDLPNIGLKPAEVAALKAGGKSVEELTDFCKKIAEKGDSLFPSDDSDAGGKENNSDNEAPFVHHPFRTRENTNIVMNIRNARQLPVLTTAQKQSLGNELRLQFPVSSGTHHRDKEREWVPVEHTSGQTTSTAAAASVTAADGKPSTAGSTAPAVTGQIKPDDKVFQDVPNVQISIKDVVSERLNALRKLNENPNDPQAMGAMHKAQEAMNKWVQSRDLPGYFTGSTGANVLSQAELAGMHQAWARKDQLLNAAPVSDGIGKFLLKKMGWKEGEGLGKEGAGSKEPLMLDFKLDRKGLASSGESTKKTPTIPVTKDLSNKHPVSALVELCNRRKWQPPNFVLVHESGPDHKKNFLFKVIVNGSEYQSTIVSTNKKHAKAQAATVCLQQLGLIPQ